MQISWRGKYKMVDFKIVGEILWKCPHHNEQEEETRIHVILCYLVWSTYLVLPLRVDKFKEMVGIFIR